MIQPTTAFLANGSVVIYHPNVTHFEVRDGMVESNLIAPDGFAAFGGSRDTVILKPASGIDAYSVVTALMRQLQLFEQLTPTQQTLGV